MIVNLRPNNNSMKRSLFIVILHLAFCESTRSETDPRTSEKQVSETAEYQSAKAAEKANDAVAMLKHAKLLVERFPKSALAHKSIADAYYYMDFDEEAESAVRKAIEIDPEDPIAWRNLGLVLEKQEKPEEAEQAYKKAVSVAKEDPVPWESLANFYSQQDKHDFALHCANKSINLLKSKPFNAHNGELLEIWTWQGLATTLIRIEHFEEAVPLLRHAISIEPDNAISWTKLSRCYFELYDDTKAQAAAEQALKIDPQAKSAKRILKDIAASSDDAPAPTVDLDKLERLTDLMIKLKQLSNPHDQQYLEMIKQLQTLNGSRTRARNGQTPEEANAWWQAYQNQVRLDDMQNEIRRLRANQKN